MNTLVILTLLVGSSAKIIHSDEEWLLLLGRERYCVMRRKATESSFSGRYFKIQERGTYSCAGCNTPLFSSEDQFDAGIGWPSFHKPINQSHIWIKEDRSLPFLRYEVLCRSCDSHLGHVFRDHEGGPLRYTINSIALEFIPAR